MKITVELEAEDAQGLLAVYAVGYEAQLGAIEALHADETQDYADWTEELAQAGRAEGAIMAALKLAGAV